jgi:hypothetical protein
LIRRRSSRACRCSVTSRTEADTSRPWSVSRADRAISAGKVVPSRRRPDSSRPAPISRGRGSVAYPARRPGWAALKASGTRISTGCPASSSRGYPNSRSAWAFTSTIRPPESAHTIASGAASSSPRNRALARLRSVISRVIEDVPTTTPLASRIGKSVSDTSMMLPSLRRSRVSNCSISSPCRTRWRTGISSAAVSGGMTRDALRPMISAAVKPYIRSAAAFQLVITPSTVELTIDSFADPTMAASRVSSSNSRLARTSRPAPGPS